MPPTRSRIIIYGNAGSGKTTMARALCASRGLAHLDLDTIAWLSGAVRRPLDESIAALREFIEKHPEWVIEGCYATLIDAALPRCTELRFLNPGVDVCVRRCLARPWEPHKYATPAAQRQMLEPLLAWVREYESRDDEFSLRRHREIFETFRGVKTEYRGGWDDGCSEEA